MPRILYLSILIAGPLSAATLEWPSAACSGTLQACINTAVNGDVVQIRTEAEINEAPLISNKSITLTKSGAAALFSAGRGLRLRATVDGINITVSNLWFRDTISVDVGSGAAAHTQNITLSGVRADSDTATIGLAVLQQPAAASSYNVTLERSKIDVRAPASTAVLAVHQEAIGLPVLRLQNNELLAGLNGVDLRMSGNGGDSILQANRIGRPNRFPTSGGVGSFGIVAQGGNGATTAHRVILQRNVVFNYQFGISLFAVQGPLTASVVNNSILTSALHGIVLSGTAARPITGRIANNLIHRAGNCGLLFNDPATVAATADYNLYSATSAPRCNATAGANDVVGDARVLSGFDARLRSTSLAINAGNNADQPFIPIIVPIATPDHDARNGRSDARVDIGAFEQSFETSFVHIASSANTFNNFTQISAPVTLFNSDVLQLGQFGREIDGFSSLPAGAANHLGMWYANTQWTIFAQNEVIGAIAPNRKFYALLNLNSNTNLLHISTPANTVANVTELNDPLLNNRPDAIPIVTQRWDPENDGSGIYNNSAIGVWYNTSSNRWTVFNQAPVGGLPLSIGASAAFNVMIPNPLFAVGSHAYRTEPLGVSVAIRNLDHPLLNNNACAHPYVSASYNPNNVYVPANLLVSYNPASDGRGNWAIERGDGELIPAGAAFHVYIDPQLAKSCGEQNVLASGFED
jgi:hypothetical protein